MKKVSIICITYKRPHLLEEAIYSVIRQSYTDWEMIIINDCPGQTLVYDESEKILVFNVNEKFSTLGAKRNFGIQAASGDYILFLDDDDILLKDYLSVLISKVSNYNSLDQQRVIEFDGRNNKWGISEKRVANTVLFRKSAELLFPDVNIDTNNEFLLAVRHRGMLRASVGNNNLGYVSRVISNSDYRVNQMSGLSNEVFNSAMELVPFKEGEITLVPQWRMDYESLVEKNISKSDIEFPDLQSLIAAKGTSSEKPTISKWGKVKNTWEKAHRFISSASSRGLASTIKNVLNIDSDSGMRVSDEIYETRKVSCFGNIQSSIASCVMLRKDSEDGFFCGACGCGKNKLARLDGEGYTKLHYPHLECPLEKRGFSNDKDQKYMIVSPTRPPISIIIPVLNDNEEVNLTIQSIYETSPSNVEIIVIDDASDIPVTLNDSRVTLKRLPFRIGAGQARHFGATVATSDYLLFTDSHMRFDENWFNNAMERLTKTPKTLWCGVCAGLSEGNMDLKKHKGSYTGADFVLYATKNNTVFDGVWRKEVKDQDDYEISCVMGACYFMHKSWYFYIKGLQQTTMWGSEEPILSLKTWLAGGEVRLMKSVRVGHKFRGVAPYSTNVRDIYYNKLAYMYMLLPDEMYSTLKNKLPAGPSRDSAEHFVQINKEELDKEKKYYESIFLKDINWFIDKFKIKYEC